MAKRSLVYLTDLTTDNRIAIQWHDGRCDWLSIYPPSRASALVCTTSATNLIFGSYKDSITATITYL